MSVATRLLLVFAASVSLFGCASFSGKPALPKHGSIERVPRAPASTDFAALIENAEIIYFPQERVGFGGKSEPAALLIAALEKSGRPFAIGWDLIDATQQSSLDLRPLEDNIITSLVLTGSGRAREYCRSVMRELRNSNVTFLALRFPTETVALTAHRRDLAAEKIARYVRSAGPEARALIFLREEDLESELGVPSHVAQRIAVRQLVLGPPVPKKERAPLLTEVGRRANSADGR